MIVKKDELMNGLDFIRNASKLKEREVWYLSNEKVLAGGSAEMIFRQVIDLGPRSFSTYCDKFHSILSRIDSNEVEIEVEDELKICAGSARSGLRLIPEREDFALPPIPETFDGVNEDFAKGLEFVLVSCAKDLVVPALTCAQIRPGSLDSCDQYRASHWDLKETIHCPEKGFLLPADIIREALRIPGGIKGINFHQDEGMVHFKGGNGSFLSCYSYADEMIDLSNIFDIGQDAITVQWPEGFASSLRRAEVFSEEGANKTVEISINRGIIKLQSSSEEGWFKENKAAANLDKTVRTAFRISVQHLQDVLAHNVPAQIGRNRILFVGPNWKHVISTILTAAEGE